MAGWDLNPRLQIVRPFNFFMDTTYRWAGIIRKLSTFYLWNYRILESEVAFRIRNSKPLSHFSKWKKKFWRTSTTCAKARLWLSCGSADGGPSTLASGWSSDFTRSWRRGWAVGGRAACFPVSEAPDTRPLTGAWPSLEETGCMFFVFFFPSFSFSHFFFFFLIYPAGEGQRL